MNKRIVLFSICLGLLVIADSCIKGFKKVTVRVYDVDTNEGIEGIDLYVETSLVETDQYVTDANGIVELGRREYIRGSSIQTNLSIPGYTTPEIYKDCERKTVFPIEGKTVEIPLEKLKILKLKFLLPLGSEQRKGCLILHDLETCNSKLDIYFELKKNGLKYPTDFNREKNKISMYMNTPPESWKLDIYYDTYCDSDFSNNQPDQIQIIPTNTGQDTTFYTVQLK